MVIRSWKLEMQNSFYAKFCAICPETWKRGLILCLLNIAKHIWVGLKTRQPHQRNLKIFSGPYFYDFLVPKRLNFGVY